MPLPVAELLRTTRSYSESMDGATSLEMQFKVPTTSYTAALAADGIPKLGVVMADDPSMTCHNRTATPTGNASILVTVTYSTTPFSLFRRLAIADRLSWNWIPGRRAKVDIPLNIYDYITDPAGGLAVVNVWVKQDRAVQEIRSQRLLTITYTMPRNTSITIFDSIDDQTDKLHLLQGSYWRFVDGGVRRLNQTTFELTYNWERDRGTIIPGGVFSTSDSGPPAGTTPPEPVIVQIPSDADPGFLRDPYSEINVIKSQDPRSFYHKSTLVRPYAIDETGWRDLPGVPQNLG